MSLPLIPKPPKPPDTTSVRGGTIIPQPPPTPPKPEIKK